MKEGESHLRGTERSSEPRRQHRTRATVVMPRWPGTYLPRYLGTCAAVALLLTGCSTIKPDLRADLVRAQEIAQAKGDKAGIACMGAHLAALDAKVPMPEVVGPVSAYMKAREVHRGVAGGENEDVGIACAKLRLDALRFLYKIGSMIFPAPPLPGR